MCGIAGYSGNRSAAVAVMEALDALSYRGYDSAGIAVYDKEKEKNEIRKCAGKTEALKAKLGENPLPDAVCAIGHTRWATHGAVCDRNSHPHESDGLCLVHNGIIENHVELRRELEEKGYVFRSDTDTEALAHLVDHYFKTHGSATEALRAAEKRICGSFAAAVIFNAIPNTIFAIRRESPLLIGIGEGEVFLGSDLPAFIPYTRQYFRLRDGEIAEICGGRVTVTNSDGAITDRELCICEAERYLSERGAYQHHMRAEIAEEEACIARLVSHYMNNGFPTFPIDNDKIREAKSIRIIGCGTAYHAGIYIAELIKRWVKIPAVAEIASEFRYSEPIINDKEIIFFISQSGETADTVSSLRLAKSLGAYTVGIVNAEESTVACEADTVLYTLAGIEIAVASTKAYTAQCTLGAMLTAYIADIRGKYSPDKCKAIKELSKSIKKAADTEHKIKSVADSIAAARSIFFIGRRLDYATGLEASLKLKEISYIHSECYPAGELKHGTISLIEDGTPVIAILTDERIFEKTLTNLKETKARGALTVAVVSEGLPSTEADIELRIPDTLPELAPIAAATVLQLLAYHTAKNLGCDIDMPRNLAKSVTVE